MHEQLDELLAARDQMEQLLAVVVEIGRDLDLDATLHRIVAAAMTLTGARYGALGVRGRDSTLSSFLHAGMNAETVRRIGHLPAGKGVLGLLLNQTESVRLDDLSQHPAAVGFPEHHPKMGAFLGVPITLRGNVFGSLYVTDDRPGHRFTESDEIASRALAGAAAFAIDNARLFQQVRASATWMEASREITTALLSGVDPHIRPLHVIVDRARELTGAEQAIVLVPADADVAGDDIDTLVVSTAVGLHAEEVIGQRVPVSGSTTGGVFRSGVPVITDRFRYPIPAFTDIGERPALLMPLCAQDAVVGVLAVARNAGQPPFDSGYLQPMSDFAHHAAIALTLAASREQAGELTILADRERIAHDLHDHVIQKLFAAGMDLQGTIARSRSSEITERLSGTVDDLQNTINDIRTTIFKLQTPAGPSGGFRQRVQNAVADLTNNRDIATTVHMSGPMTVVGGDLADHGAAVVIEAISNTLRHSGATSLTVEVTIMDDVSIDIVDNGHGIPADNQRRSGLANLQRRAQQAGGDCHISSPPAGGTRVHWTAPLLSL
ncbi:MAG TPA: GAF domain-containing sensor histidine kinase [Mycobacterium sp.]|uniref:GAF domain-containing sensor histidine kinase n=1 Tax=Mycobacterium sp. TaxID=1785 RepID=UPI002BD95B97|nr:GAF domain-containing sensor histidine kinase [Mycobacterium sp.]HME77807.1 GAF domain-containing sensor histidine kinase [Mycobacterium sp.]